MAHKEKSLAGMKRKADELEEDNEDEEGGGRMFYKFWFYVHFNTLQVISGQCLLLAGRMLAL